VQMTMPTHGPFTVSLRLGGATTNRFDGHAMCSVDRVALANGQCGCKAGFFQLSELQPCEACPYRSTSSHGAVGRPVDACSICATGFFRPSAHSPSSQCEECLDEAICHVNATIPTIALRDGHWRHSPATTQTHKCRALGDWTPCRGGGDAGVDGSGYCDDTLDGGFKGPRCEVCTQPNHYFDRLEVRCHDCGDVAARVTMVIAILFALLLACSGVAVWVRRLDESSETGTTTRNLLLRAKRIWHAAGLRFKFKVLIGFYQCMSATPSIFEIDPPPGLEAFNRWISFFELPADLQQIIVAPACVGDFRDRLLAGSLWPIAPLAAAALGFIGMEFVSALADSKVSVRERFQTALVAGLRRALPFILGLTFLIVPSISTRLFKTFSCDSIEYSSEHYGPETRRYLHTDPDTSCDTDSYRTSRSIAIMLIVLWPVGVPLLYAVLLRASSDAVLNQSKGAATALSLSTRFLAHMNANSLIMPFSLSLKVLSVSVEMAFHRSTSTATSSFSCSCASSSLRSLCDVPGLNCPGSNCRC
jgi:hypothetical protein